MKFDNHIDRSNKEATKWERYRNEMKGEFIPLWIADMDLPCSEAIQASLIKRAKHSIYGYTDRSTSYNALFATRFSSRYVYEIDKDDVILSTGVMYSIACALRLFTKEQDEIVVFTPCYHPFRTTIENCGRRITTCTLKEKAGRFFVDEVELDKKLETATALLLCNPHNPTGKVFTKREVACIANLCEKHNAIIISDEIHCDITYEHPVFHPIMMENEYTKQHTVACVSPTKSFNIAGLKISAAIIKNREWYVRFQKEASTTGISSINLFAMEAVKAAYLQSDEWQKEVMLYLKGNREFIDNFLQMHMPNINYNKPEGTYFYWLDFSNYVYGDTFFKKFKEEGGIILSKGEEFDENCTHWLRMNFACPREMIKDALYKIKELLEREKTI